jgi:hypothetical protein
MLLSRREGRESEVQEKYFSPLSLVQYATNGIGVSFTCARHSSILVVII